MIVEVQLAADDRKRFTWPAYVANLRARLGCPVCLLVFAGNDAVAKWASKPIEMGGDHVFTPYVIAPSGVPEIVDEETAREQPELAVLSAITHGRDADARRAARIAAVARKVSKGLDTERSTLYLDLVSNFLSEAALAALNAMDIEGTRAFIEKWGSPWDPTSRWSIEWRAERRREAELEAKRSVLLRQLEHRFGALTEFQTDRVLWKSATQLDELAVRLLTAFTVEEALGPPPP